MRADTENLRAALVGVDAEEAFITAISPSNLELYYENRYYASDEEYLTALADAMHEEYKAIVDAGFLLQIDDPRMATHYNRTPRGLDRGLPEVHRTARRGGQSRAARHSGGSGPISHLLQRQHRAPHARFRAQTLCRSDAEVRAGAYVIEAANPRHEHEWQIWEDVKLPDGKLLVPGVVSHCIHLVEHPELVAQRIARFAGAVGRERVIAGTDCGFGTSGAGDEVHPDVAWAKLAALVEGAGIASRRLWAM